MSVFKKSVAVALAAFALAAGSAHADKYGMAGCGLGSMVFQDKPGKIQILSGTTNGTFGSQTFGITSGTSNCEASAAREEASLFILVNEAALAKDISRGSGETLASLTKILRCSDEATFGATMQKNYDRLFTADKSVSLSDKINETIRTDAALSRSCGLAG